MQSKYLDSKPCVVCGKTMFWLNKHQFPKTIWDRKTTCSIPCRTVVVAKKKFKGLLSAVCKNCAKEFSYARGARKRIFCSFSCRGRYYHGEASPLWKGGRRRHNDGYWEVAVGKGHPFAKNGFRGEHRVVMEKYLLEHRPDSPHLIEIDGKKYLAGTSIVHHINRDKGDNRLENLQIVSSQKEHFDHNYCPHCPHCKQKSGELLETLK